MLFLSMPRFRFLFLLFALFISFPYSSRQASVLGERELPALSPEDTSLLIESPDPLKNLDPTNPASHLSKILIPRAPDTDNNTLVRNYIVSTLKALDWHIEEDEFMDDTPVGKKRFTNVIATKDPEASRRVVLSAHFDSKYFSTYPQNQFVGATDSAAPCAMMLDLAETLNPMLNARKTRLEDGLEDDDDIADTTLQLVFFDGEEAFHDWTDTDSIYGARHLAEKWSTTYIVPHSKRRLMGMQATEISTIEHLILLDLLGAPQPLIRSYYLDTAWLFDAMASIEHRLGESGAFVYQGQDNMAAGKWTSYFHPRTGTGYNYGYIGDDHVPFMHKGVSILHIIAEPFPHVWHTLKDDASALDLPTMRRWNIILRVFMSEYLHLQPQDLKKRSEPHSDFQRSHIELG
ncbi:hypothetical protein BDQ12DRAFT_676112 [Crucibulum laeve]|uniref:Peptide hydrolase n=1 Tax=Crucibulum laeve TaxID=68775 RepID=A0A5C3MAP7_9AGAR|nr:hypothetical protein BDQ12DRAFT_676112 [Crucibulum laeve]